MDRPDRDSVPPAAAAGLVSGLPGALTGGEDLSARLERWAAEARVDEAARRRSRELWLRRQAEEESTLAGVLVDLLEAGTAVTVHTRAGRQHRGVVRAVGADVAVLTRPPGGAVVVALRGVVSVRVPPGNGGVVGDRAHRGGLMLADVLTGLAVEREPVLLVTVDGAALTGVVRSVGGDVAVVRGSGEPPTTCYVPLDAIGEVVVGGP
jgi:hypothetical protein